MSPLQIDSGSKKAVILGSRRKHGNMKHADNEHGQHYRRLFLNGVIRPDHPAARLKLAVVEHGSEVRVVSGDWSETIAGCDALVTRERNIFIAVTYADCPPVVLFDLKAGLAAVAHCGYKSLHAGVLRKTAQVLCDLGAHRNRLRAFVGPHIGECCYEFGLNHAQRKFGSYHGCIVERNTGADKCRLDLGGIIGSKLIREEKLMPAHVRREFICTHCGPHELFSARKDRTNPVQAGLFGIMLT